MELFKGKEFTFARNGSEEKVYKKVISADLVSCKKIGHQIWHLSRVFGHNSGPGDGNLNECPRSFRGGGGMLKLLN